ncbi:MAG: DUF2087 domain-containing protein [Candidatus Microbacterium phytovorans]|uniref:DUF2087 domain-containing protein n=1 Tax=Candidatus Microbacterium phytovorans TaxID=3121374 RepID=A0AAJ6B3L4_9MICO|nr:DUF2087 domain-containing protein [Microbacterium sp.]WEK14285.1 MAG: DUF2087 domain-containing protein [Microbacterium sp.]
MAPARIHLDLIPRVDTTSWTLRVDGVDVGVLRGSVRSSDVELFVEVDESARRRGIARAAIGRLLGSAPWGHDVRYIAEVDAGDEAAASLARRLGFTPEDAGGAGHKWSRSAPRARAAADDIARFLDRDGRIDRYPLRSADRKALLTWVAARALPHGVVLDEAAVNARLEPYAPAGDVAVLRRYLVDHGLVERTRSGSEYVRVERVAG